MHAHGYIHVREALDRALDVFVQHAGTLSADDLQLKRELEMVRLKVVRSETGMPFSSQTPVSKVVAAAPPPMPALPPDLTKAPWSR